MRFSEIKDYIVFHGDAYVTKTQLQAVITQCQQCFALMGTNE